MPSSKIGIDVFSPAGFLETTIPWTEGSRIIALAWNHKEQLVVVADNAMVHLYDVRKGVTVKKFGMGSASEVKRQGGRGGGGGWRPQRNRAFATGSLYFMLT